MDPIACAVAHRALNVLYNLDRAIASAFGALPQDTISGEAGKLAHRELWASVLCKVLNTIDPGHCQHAEARDQALDAADPNAPQPPVAQDKAA